MPTRAPLAGWIAGTVAGLVSTAALAWRGRVETGHAAAPLNAPSHWVWGDAALKEDRPSWRYTGWGLLIHQGASLMWGWLYDRVFRRPLRPRFSAHELGDAAMATTVAAVVDLVFTPRRFTPGFERRLSARGTALIYVAFAAGLLLGNRLAHPPVPPAGADGTD